MNDPPEPLPPRLAAVIRPELPSLYQEIVHEIRRAVPEYARDPGSTYDKVLRLGVERSLTAFTDRVASSGARSARLEDVHRRLGRFEAQEGRSLDALQNAYRIGGRVAWRRVMKVGERLRLSSHVMTAFADSLFAYIDELSQLAREGFLESTAESAEQLEALRRRLLRLILSSTPTAGEAVTELAGRVGWSVPEQATPVALTPEAPVTRPALDRDVLAETDGPRPHLLVPGTLTPERAGMLRAALHGAPAAAGPTTALHEVPDSMRWARQALELAQTGVLRDEPLIRCENHLLTLWLQGDPQLVEKLAERQLSPMAELTPSRRGRLVETLRTWLTTRGTAAQMADELHVHPQTVRYRLRLLERAYGERMHDTEDRFATEAVLRALHQRERSETVRGLPGRGERA